MIIMTICFYHYSKQTQIDQLKVELNKVSQGVEDDGINFFDNISLLNYRITWIEAYGTVLYDTSV